MYYIKTNRSGKLTDLAVGAQGRVEHGSKGDVCELQSLAAAQALAKVFREYRLLG